MLILLEDYVFRTVYFFFGIVSDGYTFVVESLLRAFSCCLKNMPSKLTTLIVFMGTLFCCCFSTEFDLDFCCDFWRATTAVG